MFIGILTLYFEDVIRLITLKIRTNSNLHHHELGDHLCLHLITDQSCNGLSY